MRLLELLRLALEGVRRTPLRVALTSIGVAIATGSLVAMVAFAEGLQAQAEKPFVQLDLLERVEVSADSEDESREPAKAVPLRAAPVLDEKVLKRIAEIPGVVVAYPETLLSLRLRRGEASAAAFVYGMPREAARLRYTRAIVTQGRFFDAGEAPEIVISKRLARDLGFDEPSKALDQEITAEAKGFPAAAFLGGLPVERKLDLKVVGLLELPLFSGLGEGRYGVLPLEIVRSLGGYVLPSMATPDHGYGKIVVRTASATDADRVAEAVRGLGLSARTPASQLESLKRFFIVLDVLLGAVGSVALVVAGLGIVNTLLIAVLERQREIGALKALGATQGDVRTLFLAEAGIVGLLGGLGGIGLGRIVSWGIGLGVDAYARRRGLDAAISVFAFPWWLILGAPVFSIGASVVSGVIPALRAGRIDPIRALRAE